MVADLSPPDAGDLYFLGDLAAPLEMEPVRLDGGSPSPLLSLVVLARCPGCGGPGADYDLPLFPLFRVGKEGCSGAENKKRRLPG